SYSRYASPDDDRTQPDFMPATARRVTLGTVPPRYVRRDNAGSEVPAMRLIKMALIQPRRPPRTGSPPGAGEDGSAVLSQLKDLPARSLVAAPSLACCVAEWGA